MLNKMETGNQAFDGNSKEQENESMDSKYIRMGWSRYCLPGNPPKSGTPVEERLINYCRNYFDTALSCERQGNPPGSSARRRELHNQIALMTHGKQRTGMDINTAEKIADFAAYIATGSDMQTAIKDILEAEKEE